MGIINLINDLLWTYILVALLLGCAVWLTLRTRLVQFRMIKEMVRLLGDSGGKGDAKEKHISSFQAFAISIASRVGTGNLAGVATAIAVGGPGAVFWMWVIALLCASSSFVESTLAQLLSPLPSDLHSTRYRAIHCVPLSKALSGSTMPLWEASSPHSR